MRYFIFFGYDGTNYHGWQIQPNANSVQQELQRALSILLRKEMEVVEQEEPIPAYMPDTWQPTSIQTESRWNPNSWYTA